MVKPASPSPERSGFNMQVLVHKCLVAGIEQNRELMTEAEYTSLVKLGEAFSPPPSQDKTAMVADLEVKMRAFTKYIEEHGVFDPQFTTVFAGALSRLADTWGMASIATGAKMASNQGPKIILPGQ